MHTKSICSFKNIESNLIIYEYIKAGRHKDTKIIINLYQKQQVAAFYKKEQYCKWNVYILKEKHFKNA